MAQKKEYTTQWLILFKIHVVTTEGHSPYLQASCKFAGVGFTMVGLNATASLPNLYKKEGFYACVTRLTSV